MMTGWTTFNNEWVYLYPNGELMTSDWVEDSYGWLYMNAVGYPVKDEQLSFNDETWERMYNPYYDYMPDYSYRFDEYGYLYTNCWFLDYDCWAYAYENGRIAINTWVTDSVGWCFVDKSGHLLCDGIAEDSKYYYYMDSYGHISSDGWHNLYFSEWCYSYWDGTLAVNTWISDSHGWMYMDNNGINRRNDWAADSYGWLFLNEDGYPYKSTLLRDVRNGNIYYLNDYGYMVTGWFKTADCNYWRYAYSDGSNARNAWVRDSVGWCYLNDSGLMVTNTYVDGYYIDNTGHYYS